ncbi:MAG TPA: F0F1 ATP synthase subunit delta [Casimicrobiaceae bacterium]|nr:F0F1 ATP synthase subunit delta [Casimicrobiaceae bacterium]
MAELLTIARPYAEAVFALAQEQNTLSVWAEMLKLAGEVAADPQMRNALDNPKLAKDAKESLFLSVCGDRLNADGKNFIRVLIEAERVELLPEIRELYGTLKDEADGVARAHISSAFPLEDSQLAALKATLERRFGKKIETTISVDPELIGGAKIVVGDTVIDASVRGELQAMTNHLRT